MNFLLSLAAATALASPTATVALANAPAPALAPIPAPAIVPSVRPASPDIANAAAMTAAATLRPGEFQWDGKSGTSGPVLIQVSIADQKLYASRNGALFAVSTVSTGRHGHATPTGTFPILEKQRAHRSNLYTNASMPFMQRLTQDGVALHAGKLPGFPASHGCVRLPLAFAERLFAVTQLGGTVIVTADSLTTPAVERASTGISNAWPAPASSGPLPRPAVLPS